MPVAARLGDPIQHSDAMVGLLEGLAIGLVVGAAIVATGGAAAVVLVATAAGAVATGAGVGELIGSLQLSGGTVTGTLVTGSPNVQIGGALAARAFVAAGDTVACAGVPPLYLPPSHDGKRVAQGSASVVINQSPAARVGDLIECGAQIQSGSTTVLIGGGQVTTVQIESEVPDWINKGIMVLGLASAVVLAGPVVALAGFAGGLLGGQIGTDLGGDWFGQGSDGQKIMGFVGGMIGGGLAGHGAEGMADSLGDAVGGPVGKFIGGGMPDVLAPPRAGETPAGATPVGETPTGQPAAGETPGGETPGGETPAGETPAGETPADETPAGDAPADETPAGEPPTDETPAGETPAATPNGDAQAGGETPAAAGPDQAEPEAPPLDTDEQLARDQTMKAARGTAAGDGETTDTAAVDPPVDDPPPDPEAKDPLDRLTKQQREKYGETFSKLLAFARDTTFEPGPKTFWAKAGVLLANAFSDSTVGPDSPGIEFFQNTPDGAELNALYESSGLAKAVSDGEFPWSVARDIFEAASKNYADSASGNAYAYVDNADSTSIFRTTELGSLLENPAVSSIHFFDDAGNLLGTWTRGTDGWSGPDITSGPAANPGVYSLSDPPSKPGP